MRPFDCVPETLVLPMSVPSVGLFCEERTWVSARSLGARTCGRNLQLSVAERHHQVVRDLADIADLNRRLALELVLNRQVPLVVDRWLHVLIHNRKIFPVKQDKFGQASPVMAAR